MSKNAAGVFVGAFLGVIGVGCALPRSDEHEAFQGVVEFDERVLGFEVAGRLRTVAVHRGDAVGAGALLAVLDDGMERPVREARAADLAAARAQAQLLRAGTRQEEILTTRAQLTAARTTEATVNRTLDRNRELTERGALAPAGLDDIEAQQGRATSERRALEERLRLQRLGPRAQEIAAADARVAAAVAVLAAEDARLARYQLRTEEPGAVLEVHVEDGEVVAPGTPVATVADIHHPYVDAFVPEGRTAGLHVGTLATLRVDARSASFAARVEDVGRQTEFTPRYLFSDRERPNLVLRVRVRVDDPQGSLHAGVPAFVTFEGVR